MATIHTKKKLDAHEFSSLHDQYRRVQMTEARLTVAKAEFDLYVASLFEAHDLIQGRYALCLLCGVFFARGMACDCAGD